LARRTESIIGRYGTSYSPNSIDLGPDGKAVVHAGENRLTGTYLVQNDTLRISVSAGQFPVAYLLGDLLFFDAFETLVKQDGLQAPGTSTATALTATPAPPQTASGAAGMTNDDVVSLVSAGLSEQVIVTSVRQASVASFDLSPKALVALKSSRVPDGVLLAMQERQARAASPVPDARPEAPKYDPALTAPSSVSATRGCSEVEMMGLYKNDALPAAIGGGVVQWLAKIRNTGSVTRIVTFSWIDMYGQRKRSQVQVSGGAIATAELDRTQARLIAPVRDLALVSCQ
jgi:hypothetical protein